MLSLKTTSDGRDGVRVSIVDTGVGIDPSNLDQIFKPLFTNKEHGMGMGLSICRSIIESHNGRIWVSADRERGSTFELVLPTNGPRNVIMHSEVEQIVYLVDDDADVREGVSALLQSVGLKVVALSSTVEFLAHKRSQGPSCLVLDVRLPGLSGLDFQTELAGRRKTTFRSFSLPGTATSR